MKVSVVTVCRNAERVLPGALASLQCQSYADREWVVIDGASTDRTIRIVKSSDERLGNWVSEPDTGIYNAMNKGWQRATGDIVYFLNADDAFSDASVLESVAALFEADPALDLAIGEVIYRHLDGARTRRSFSHLGRTTIVFEDLCHQAVFARRRLFERIGGFNETYRINADFDWLIRVFRSNSKIRWLHYPVANFSDGGAHTRDRNKLVAERRQVRLQYVSPLALSTGLFLGKVINRLHRVVRGRRIGHWSLEGTRG